MKSLRALARLVSQALVPKRAAMAVRIADFPERFPCDEADARVELAADVLVAHEVLHRHAHNHTAAGRAAPALAMICAWTRPSSTASSPSHQSCCALRNCFGEEDGTQLRRLLPLRLSASACSCSARGCVACRQPPKKATRRR